MHQNMTEKIILIDGNSLAYRAFFALPETMKNAEGLPTNALYGFTNMLLRVLEDQPDYAAIAFDLPVPTFRHKAYKEYKATRQKPPSTLIQQLPYLREIARTLGVKVFEKPGFEGDDLIGTLAKRSEEAGLKVVIFSGDLDALQLVDDKISVLRTKTGITVLEEFGPKEVEAKYGLRPDQLPDYKALRGDSSDNIPGIKGIGEKTATALLQQFGTLDKMFEHTQEIANAKLKEKVETGKEIALLSRHLGTIDNNVPVEVKIEELKQAPLNWAEIIPLFERMGFNSLLKKHAKEAHQFSETPEEKIEQIKEHGLNYQSVQDEKSLDFLIERLKKAQEFAFDTETDGVQPFLNHLIGLSICFEPGSAFYIPLGHLKGKQLSLNKTLKALQPFFEDPKIEKAGHNLKFDCEMLYQYGINVANLAFDTMLAEYLVDPEASPVSLKNLAVKYLKRKMITFNDLFDGKGEKNFATIEIDLATQYAAADAEVTCSMVEILKEEMAEANVTKLFEDVEMPLLPVLIEMEKNGIFIDREAFARLAAELKKEISKLEKNIYSISGEEFNINSTKQLQDVLFHKLRLPILKKTKTGSSTDSSVLEELAGDFEIAQLLLEYRTLTKLLNTYVETLPQLIHEKTKRIHTSYNQALTSTGRLSSSNPNLQNIPVRGKLAQEIRSAFVAEKKGWVIMAADYSQVELRILAHLSQDPVLLKAFKEDQDIHRLTAAQIYGVPLESVTEEMRSNAKTVNFGIIYGISDMGLAKQLRIDRHKAKDFITHYFETYQGVRKYIDETVAQARKMGFVTTLLGRRRLLSDINSPNFNQRMFAERTAINTPVQGTAADLIKVAMVNIQNALIKKELRAKMILQVHDELVFELPENEVEALTKIVTKEMQDAIKFDIPIKVDLGTGKSWGEAKS